jgi:hypothetical protein
MTSLPPQLIFATTVEATLILMTSWLLVQPEAVFSEWSPESRKLATMAGLVLLCLTFCWSIIFGMVIVIQNLTIRM